MAGPASSFALGRLPTKEDPRTLRLSAYLADEPAPPSANWLGKGVNWPLYRNDRVGCCTCVAAGHLVRTWTDAAGEPVEIAERDVIAAYSAVSGYDPRTGRNDNGAYLLDVLNHWRRTGVGGRTIAAYAKVNVRDLNEVKLAIARFGGLDIGIDLPRSAQSQLGSSWRETRGAAGERGSWGGHAVQVAAYGGSGLTCTTWGREQRMTWGFWRAYVSEAYAVVSTDFLDTAGRSPTGFDLAGLLDDLRRVTA